MRRSTQSFNISLGKPSSPSLPPLFELCKISLFRFPPPIGQNCVQMPLPIFHVKDKISYGDFLHIDQALKPRPGRPFFWAIARESKLFTLNTSKFKDITLVFLKRIDTACSNSPPPPPPTGHGRRPNARGLLRGRGGMLKLRIDRLITFSLGIGIGKQCSFW